VSTAGVISASGLTRRFGAHIALHPLSVTLGPGGITSLLGPNGSGKSTFLRLLLGLVRPDAGSAVVDGAPLTGDGLAVRQRATYLPGELHVYGELTGRAHLAWCLRGRDGRALGRALEFATAFELPLERAVRGYSHGMKRQLLLAAALAPDVRVRILDEPTEGLDPTRRAQVLELLRADAARGTTLLVSSHHLAEVERFAGRMLFLRRGERLDDEAARVLLERAQRVLRVRFEVAPERERLERVLAAHGTCELTLLDGEARIHVRTGDPREVARTLLAGNELGPPRALAYGESSLAELYRELYGVEGV
jgi:ABC-2 type transport system ATP-binding protein